MKSHPRRKGSLIMRTDASRLLAPRWGWTGLLTVTLTLLSYAVSARPPPSLASPSPEPTWSTPSFASGAEVATDGTQTLVVWRDGSRPGELYAARVSKRGRLLDADALPLNPAPSVQAGAPAVSFDGRHFLVVWQSEHSLLLVRVSPEGAVLGAPLPIASIGGDPSSTPGIACTWRKCLVAWSDFGDPRRIRGVLVNSQDTGTATRELTLASDTRAHSSFGVPVAFSDGRFLVAWSDSRYGDTTPKLLATRVTCEGAVLDPGGFLVADAPGAQTWVDVVGTKQGFFLAWSDSRGGTASIFGTLVRSSGAVPDRDGFPLSQGADDALPSLAYDGQRVLVTWTRLRPERYSLRGNLVRPEGTGASPDGFPLSDGDFIRELDSDVLFQDGQYFMTYGAAPTIDEPPFQVILGTRLRTDGTRVDDPALRISHHPSVEDTALAPPTP